MYKLGCSCHQVSHLCWQQPLLYGHQICTTFHPRSNTAMCNVKQKCQMSRDANKGQQVGGLGTTKLPTPIGAYQEY